MELIETIRSSEAYNPKDSIQTLLDWQRSVAFVDIARNESDDLIFKLGQEGINAIKVPNNKNFNLYILYRPAARKNALELLSIAQEYGGILPSTLDQAPAEVIRRIGQLLEYDPDDIESFINSKLKAQMIAEQKIKTIIKEVIGKLFENFDDEDYFSSFEFEDIPEMEPGGAAHQAFLDDLKKDPSMGTYRKPSEDELNKLTKSLQQANLDLPSDQSLMHHAEKNLYQTLNEPEKIKAIQDKSKMKKMFGAGSYNESIRRKIRTILNELNSSLISDPKQIAMARKLTGDNFIIILNKLNWGVELTLDEMDEAREKYLSDYIFEKAKLSKEKRKANPINLQDLEAMFDAPEHILNTYLSILINRYSHVEQIPELERKSLLNSDDLDTAENANDEIAKKYLIKVFSNITVPLAGDNKWTRDYSDEAVKAYRIAFGDNKFAEKLMDILKATGRGNTYFFKAIEETTKEYPRERE